MSPRDSSCWSRNLLIALPAGALIGFIAAPSEDLVGKGLGSLLGAVFLGGLALLLGHFDPRRPG